MGAIGHDFYEGERDGPRGFPRFTDPRLRGPEGYGDYSGWQWSGASSAAAPTRSTCCSSTTRTGAGSSRRRSGRRCAQLRDEGLAGALGARPRPGKRLHARHDRLLRALRRADRLGDADPQPVRALAGRARARRRRAQRGQGDHPRGGLRRRLPRRRAPRPRASARTITAGSGPRAGSRRAASGSTASGRSRTGTASPCSQLACAWNLSHEAVKCVAPTLIQESGPGAKPIERKRAELAAVAAESPLSEEEVAAIRAVGDNTGSMLLKGATPDHDGEERPDRWAIEPGHVEIARRWGIEPERDLRRTPARADPSVRRRCFSSTGAQQVFRLRQQLSAALESLGVLRARLVETVGIRLEVVRARRALGRGGAARRASGPRRRRCLRHPRRRPDRRRRPAGCCRRGTR